MASSAPSVVITTVHGTFAPDATWVEPGSPFCQAVVTHLGLPVLIEELRWSGGNSMGARLAATTALTDHLAARLARYPEARHFVVAHSHGGNIALYALRDETLRERIDGVVCLSTPFVTCAERSWPVKLMVICGLLPMLLPIVLMVVALFALGPARIDPHGPWQGRALGLGLLLGGVGGAFALNEWAGNWVGRVRARVRESALAATHPMLPLGQALLMRGAADEASGALAAVQFGSYLMRRLVARLEVWMNNPLWWMSRVSARWELPLTVAAFVIPALLWFWPPLEKWLTPVILAWGLLSLGLLGLAMVFGVLVMALAVAVGVAFRSFDSQSIWSGVFLDISAEPSPPGQWLTVQMPPFDGGELLTNQLRHSLYDHPLAPRYIADWMRLRMRAHDAAAAAHIAGR